MTTIKKTPVSVFLGAALLVSAGSASAFTEPVRKACASDYASLCSQYKQNSTQLRRCFESNRRVLSGDCVAALVKAGEVPAKYLKR